MPTPSFILPSAPVYEEGTLYGLELYGSNFVPSPMSFTRATTATRVNADGLVELVPYNLVQQSNTFNNAIWQLIGTPTITANYDTNPLTGENDAWRFQSSGVDQRIYQVLNNSFCTFSLYAKGSGNIRIRDSSSTHSTNLTLTSSWQRFLIYIPASFTNVQISASTGGCDATIYGAQLVQGTEPLDYLPTTDRLDIARIDYSTGEPVLLLEPQRTNLCTYSEQFDNSIWNKSNVTVTANTTISPSGVVNADTITADGTNVSHYLYNNNLYSVISGNRYTISTYAKKNTNNFIQLTGFFTTFGANVWANFDLNNGVLGSIGSATTAEIKSIGNGWYRCSITGTAITSAVNVDVLTLVTSATSIRGELNTLTTSVYLWGFQSEAGSYATSYIPTTSASVTRNTDQVSKTGISSLIGQTEGVIFLDIFASAKNADGLSFATWIIAGDAAENFQIYNSGTTLNWYARNTAGLIIDQSADQTIVEGTRYKIAFAYKSGDYALYINGVQKRTNANANVPVGVSQFNLSAGGYGASPAIVKNEYNAAALWKTRLTNDQLAQLTTL